jgi:hypothetical protein
MPATLVAHTSAGGTSGSVTSTAINTTGANMIVLGVVFDGGGNPTITDSMGNSWTGLANHDSGSSFNFPQNNTLWYCLNPSTSATHTFSVNGANRAPALFVQAFSNIIGYTGSFAGDGTGTGTVVHTGVVALQSVNNSLAVTVLGVDRVVGFSIDLGFTVVDTLDFLSGNHYGGAMANLITANTGTINPTWTTSISASKGTTIVVFSTVAVSTQPIMQILM